MPEQPIVPPTQAEIERQRKRFDSAEKKLNKLYDALDGFEKEYGDVDNFSSWLESALNNKAKLEEITNSFSDDVKNNKSVLEEKKTTVMQQAEDLISELEKNRTFQYQIRSTTQ